MAPEKRDIANVWDMIDACGTIAELVHGRTYDQYLNEKMFRLAVERAIEIIGEAARRLTPGLRAAHPEVPWNAIMAQRHILAHEYDELKHEMVWRVATFHVPALLPQLETIHKGLEQAEQE
jgi:uncharacterized protein with HEPN domain